MDDLRRIDLNLLLTLQALLAEQHVSRAALRLHKSQPAVSHALAQLRDLLGDALLERRGGRLALTPRAQALVLPLEEALNQLRGLLLPPVFDAAQSARCFRLAMSDYGASVVLPRLMGQLRREAPGVQLVVTQASREGMLAQLLDGEIDLALGVFPALPETLQAQTLFEESFACLADRQSLPAKGGLDLAEWLARPHVQVAMRPGVENEIDRALAAAGVQRSVLLNLPHWGAAAAVVAGTDLILTVARRSLLPWRRDASLRIFAPPLLIPAFAFQQVWHGRRQGDAALHWLRGAVLKACEENTVK